MIAGCRHAIMACAAVTAEPHELEQRELLRVGPSEERLHSPVVIVLDEYSGLHRSDLEHILGALQPHRIRTAEVCETRISVDDVPVQIGLVKQEELVLGERVRTDIQQSMPAKEWIASVSDGVSSCKHCRGTVAGTCYKMARDRHFLKFPNCSHSKCAAKLRRKAAFSQAAAAGAAAAAAAGAAARVAAAVGNAPPAPVSDDGGSKVDDLMGVGEDPVGEDGMDIDAPAWPPAGVEAADEDVIREGDPGDFYTKVIAKNFRGVWHYGVITGVVTEWVLEDYGGATQWRVVFEDGDAVDLLRLEVVEAMAAAQEHPTVDADGEARLVTVPEGDDRSSESEEEGWEGGGDAAGAGWTSDEEEEEEEAHLRAWESAVVPGSETNALTFAVMKCSAQWKSKNSNNSADSEWQLLHDIMPAGFTWGGMAVPRSHKAMRKFLRGCVAFSGAPGKAAECTNLPDQHCPECNADRFIRMPQSLKLTAARVWYVLSVADIIKGCFRDSVWYACWKKGTGVSINAFRASSEAERLNEGGHGTGLAAGDFLHADNGIYTLTDDGTGGTAEQ
eukprot:jgi/Tetstr1/438778/TSEL_027287.t1